MRAAIYIDDIDYMSDRSILMEKLEKLPEHRREAVDRMLFMHDKKLSVSAWFLLERALKKEGYGGPAEIIFNEHGKPYLKDGGLFFNLSHSEKMVMCIVSDEECGCDIERVHEVKEGLSVRFFSADENDFVRREEDSLGAFFRIWTMKEAYIKAKGTGFSENLSSFSVLKGVPGYELHEFEIEDGYAASCCVKEGCEVLYAGKI